MASAMSPSTSFLLLFFFLQLKHLCNSILVNGFEVAPAPSFNGHSWPGSAAISPSYPSPFHAPSLIPSPAKAADQTIRHSELAPTPDPERNSPLPEPTEGANEEKTSPAREPSPAPSEDISRPAEHEVDNAPPKETDPKTVKWCAVRDEFVDCQYYISLLKPVDNYSWKCVQRQTTQECLQAIKAREADLIVLDPGLAYIAFLNYSMKSILNEVYCNHAQTYDAVAVVNKKACERSETISIQDYKGKRSCHGLYASAAGWNYPIHTVRSYLPHQGNDVKIVKDFFSETCAPSELEGTGLCTGCGNQSSCLADSPYSGDLGAFRCLIEEVGDIAFVKADTPLLYSKEGPYNQSWSTKSINQFMYLCPKGGCRAINGYPGTCKFGSVPAKTIMAPNSISSKKRLAILQTLLNATWADSLYTGRNGASHLLSSGTQSLAEVKQLTRSYLGVSATISQTLQELNIEKVQSANATSIPVLEYTSCSTCILARHLWLAVIFISWLGLL
ncbi:hypothetical protein AMTRI_Chr07g74560 [Amborella trichopoda]